tara:strand:+ start:807 stop:1043 length:237 start_codon:yes stop_codon:yes gene_type:complete
MDIPNLSKYLVYEDGTVYAKNRGLMLTGSYDRLGRQIYGMSFDDDILKFKNMKQTTLKLMYQDELLRFNKKLVLAGAY